MAIKKIIFDPELHSGTINARMMRQNVIRYLYQTGNFEKWCLQWQHDPHEYWLSVFGAPYQPLEKEQLARLDAELLQTRKGPGSRRNPGLLRQIWLDFFG